MSTINILVTNDDGVGAPGLQSLAAAMEGLGKVWVLAPSKNWSASGHVKTLHKPLRVQSLSLADGRPAHACSGAPADCVALALMGLFEIDFDLVVSGINPNANMAQDVTYSGTVTAAMEAVLLDTPGLAVSTNFDPEIGYGPSAEWAAKIAKRMLADPPPPDTVLNLNLPARGIDDLSGLRVTSLGKRDYRDHLVRREDPFGRPYFWIGGEGPVGMTGDGTDVAALDAGFASLTPIHMDMTAKSYMGTIEGWDLEG